MKIRSDTNSYMQLTLHMDSGPKYLMVPTYYDESKNEWCGFVRLTKAQKLIYGRGKDSYALEQDFNRALRAAFEGEHGAEAFELFKPLSYWDEMEEEK